MGMGVSRVSVQYLAFGSSRALSGLLGETKTQNFLLPLMASC